jgi:iron complex transport system substrate-binding protein
MEKVSMKQTKRAIVVIAILVMLVAGCNPSVPQNTTLAENIPAPTETETTTQESPNTETITFIDALDREVTIKYPAMKIVSLAPSVTESLFAIGAGNQVIGRTDYCDYPEAVTEIPTIGGFSSSSISIEKIISLEPDLVISGSTLQRETIQALDKAGIPTFVNQPANLQETIDAIILLGKISGHHEEALNVAGEMRTRVDSVKKFISSIPQNQRPTVFYEVWHEPLMTANDKTMVGELIEIAGGINVFAELPDQYPTISAEQLIELDPTFIIGPSSHGDQMTAEVIGNREGWKNMSAVKTGQIHIVDGNIVSRASPRLIEALDSFVKILHPEIAQ